MRPLEAVVCLLVAALAVPVAADVATDGTAGPRVRWSGNFEISADLGTRAGRNLFHSFERFDLAAGERATFSGPDEIRNVIRRVTGDARSDIDGTIRSTTPGADLYLLTPPASCSAPTPASPPRLVPRLDRRRHRLQRRQLFYHRPPDDAGASDASAGISIEVESVTIGSDSVVTVDAPWLGCRRSLEVVRRERPRRRAGPRAPAGSAWCCRPIRRALPPWYERRRSSSGAAATAMLLDIHLSRCPNPRAEP